MKYSVDSDMIAVLVRIVGWMGDNGLFHGIVNGIPRKGTSVIVAVVVCMVDEVNDGNGVSSGELLVRPFVVY
jgi:hypothetical protein